MKKIVSFLLCIILIFSITACGSAGDTSNVKVDPIKSSIYTDDDYKQAVNVAMSYFHRHFTDCTMTNIRYVGDDMEDAQKEWAKDYDMDEVIILTSDFKTGRHSDKSLDPDSKYTDWQWILARNKGGKWKHKDHGYG